MRSSRSAIPWLAFLGLLATPSCALLDGLSGSSESDAGIGFADGLIGCIDDPFGFDCPTSTCDDPFFLGDASNSLTTQVDTCGKGSASPIPLCGEDGVAPDIVFSFDIDFVSSYEVCVFDAQGGRVAVSDFCGAIPPPDGAFTCLDDNQCVEFFPNVVGRQFLRWEGQLGGGCGTMEIEINPRFDGMDASMPDSNPGMDGGVDAGPAPAMYE